MKFLFIAPRLHPNLQYQLEALMQAGHEVEVFALHSARGEVNERVAPRVFGYSKCFTILRALIDRNHDRFTRSRFELKYAFPPIARFIAAVWGSHADVLVIKNIEHVYSFLALLTGWVMRKRLIVIVSIEKHRPKPFSWSVFAVGKFFGARVITPLEGNPKYENRNANLFYVPLPHPISPVSHTYAPGGVVRIICVGKFSRRKDQMLLLRAARDLRLGRTFSISFIGLTDETGYLAEMRRFIADNGLSDMVSFVFDMPWRLVLEEYPRHDVFVLPSYSEPYSFAALEAMSFGLPAIVSDENGIKWYVRDGENGYVIQKGNLTAMTFALRNLLDDPERLFHMGRAARESVERTCSLKRYRDTIVGLISPMQ